MSRVNTERVKVGLGQEEYVVESVSSCSSRPSAGSTAPSGSVG
eukprot:CAMPEP_0184127298 /NCGR_PEP_ID=MMETSP0974-20121125/25995_1 /TAXON_ID=483370 /ORGANISM="non described non described, Strain CCMP2097" /LENGTH=42 /DNA_ID= /DNA_START= /DNA_END= /DNA_ORIENTATION=